MLGVLIPLPFLRVDFVPKVWYFFVFHSITVKLVEAIKLHDGGKSFRDVAQIMGIERTQI
jgi:hypothetical protein